MTDKAGSGPNHERAIVAKDWVARESIDAVHNGEIRRVLDRARATGARGANGLSQRALDAEGAVLFLLGVYDQVTELAATMIEGKQTVELAASMGSALSQLRIFTWACTAASNELSRSKDPAEELVSLACLYASYLILPPQERPQHSSFIQPAASTDPDSTN